MRPISLAEWLTYAEAQHPENIEMGLERTRLVAERLGVLERPWDFTYIVAGTNGKGSTTVALESLLLEQGYRPGATLSPHVHVFNERVRLNGVEASDPELCEAFAAVDSARGDVPLTYFEFSALVALVAFQRARIEVAILEIGLGGRLDAFNVIDADVAVVTSIGLDHQAFLGDDLEQIGREKAGVFRQGQTVVLGAVTDSVRQAARALNCLSLEAGRDFLVAQRQNGWDYRGPPGSFTELPSGALAPTNWGLAITAAGEHADLDRSRVVAAIARGALPGRLEQHMLGSLPLLLDVAHNPAGAAFLAAELDRTRPGARFIGVLGMLADKPPEGVVAALGERVTRWLAVPTSGARAQDAPSLCSRLAPELAVIPCDTVAAGLDRALSSRGSEDGILVIGSFSVVEQARNWLSNQPSADG